MNSILNANFLQTAKMNLNVKHIKKERYFFNMMFYTKSCAVNPQFFLRLWVNLTRQNSVKEVTGLLFVERRFD